MLPLDLHVLSLWLAFILSQDQTLRCNLYLYLFLAELTSYLSQVVSKKKDFLFLRPAGLAAAGRLACIMSLSSLAVPFRKAGAKIWQFHDYRQIFHGLFL